MQFMYEIHFLIYDRNMKVIILKQIFYLESFNIWLRSNLKIHSWLNNISNN